MNAAAGAGSTRVAACAAIASRSREAAHLLSELRIAGAAVLVLAIAGCNSLPKIHYESYSFPDIAYVGDVKDRPYTELGQVRARVDFPSLDPTHDEDQLCKNYFNKGVGELVKQARDKGADAVIGVQSVTFNADGTVETYNTPQCADDGQHGQVLLQGVAVTWGKAPLKAVALALPSTRKFRVLRLKKDEDGMDGGIFVASRAGRDVVPGAVELYTMDRKILGKVPVPGSATDVWLSAELLRSAKSRTIFMNSQDLDDNLNARLLSTAQERIAVVAAEDPVTRKSAPLILTRNKKMDWRLTRTEPADLLEVDGSDPAKVTYIRYHLDLHGGWLKFSSSASGNWDASQPFPPESLFPKSGYSPK